LWNDDRSAKRTAMDYKLALQLVRRKDPDWAPKVKMCSAREKKGIDKVWEIIDEYRAHMSSLSKVRQCLRLTPAGWLAADGSVAGAQVALKRNQQSSKWMWNHLNQQLMRSVSRSPEVRHRAEKMNEDLARGFVSPRSAAAIVLDLFLASERANASEHTP
jgi:LAO/AO transport system kinase